jgi:hypothetical protein
VPCLFVSQGGGLIRQSLPPAFVPQQAFSLITAQLRGLSTLTGKQAQVQGVKNPVLFLLHNLATVRERQSVTPQDAHPAKQLQDAASTPRGSSGACSDEKWLFTNRSSRAPS